jgi:hypothetical protein
MLTLTRPDGTKESLSEWRVTAMVLDEFYQKTQMMIGEAIAASGLVAFDEGEIFGTGCRKHQVRKL